MSPDFAQFSRTRDDEAPLLGKFFDGPMDSSSIDGASSLQQTTHEINDLYMGNKPFVGNLFLVYKLE